MNWNLSKGEYFADFYIVPLLLIAAVARAPAPDGPVWPCAVAVVAGAAMWSLLEYVLHRWTFHTFYRRDHARHHAKPKDWIGVKPWVSIVSLVLVWAAAVRVFGERLGAWAFAGFALGYYAYLVVHACIHHSSARWVARARARHELHHRRPGVNYGVTSRFWDLVFRSYQAPVPD